MQPMKKVTILANDNYQRGLLRLARITYNKNH